jgi:UDP-glucose 4-epimerase
VERVESHNRGHWSGWLHRIEPRGRTARTGLPGSAVDNFSQGTELNIAPLLAHPSFTVHRVDVRDEAAFDQAAEGAAVIVHLAAYKIPRYSDAIDTLTINAMGSINVANAARRQGAKLVAASTSDVYGKNPAIPFTEDSDLVVGSPHVRRWAYAISKMYVEAAVRDARTIRHRRGAAAVRGHGPNQHLSWWEGRKPSSSTKCWTTRPASCTATGSSPLAHLCLDHVDGIVRAIENPAANNQVFNIGSTREITIEDSPGCSGASYAATRNPSYGSFRMKRLADTRTSWRVLTSAGHDLWATSRASTWSLAS